jgi:hypothetical protein
MHRRSGVRSPREAPVSEELLGGDNGIGHRGVLLHRYRFVANTYENIRWFLFAEVDVTNDFLLHHVRGHYQGLLWIHPARLVSVRRWPLVNYGLKAQVSLTSLSPSVPPNKTKRFEIGSRAMAEAARDGGTVPDSLSSVQVLAAGS